MRTFSSGLGNTVGQFRQEAGPSRSFESSGAQGTLQGAIDFPDAKKIEEARGLVTNQYQGPSQLDQSQIQNLVRMGQGLRDFGSGLRGPGLETLVSEAAPGLTPGQVRFESQQLSSDPGFRQRAQSFAQKIQGATAGLPTEQREAREDAERRRVEEAEIARRSGEYLRDQRARVLGGIDERVEAAKAQQQEAGNVYGQFQETGDLNTLLGSGIDLGADLSGFDSDTRRRIEEARARYDEITGGSQYFEDGNLPLSLRTNKQGRERYAFSPELREELRGVAHKRALKRRLRGIQKELETEFRPRRDKDVPFSDVKPLYFGDEFEPPEARNYIAFDPGISPARENVSEADERQVFNSINEILGQAERLVDAGEGVRAAAITADVDRYLEDEERSLDELGESVEKGRRRWRQKVKKARARYRKLRRKTGFAAIAGVVPLGAGDFFHGTATGLMPASMQGIMQSSERMTPIVGGASSSG